MRFMGELHPLLHELADVKALGFRNFNTWVDQVSLVGAAYNGQTLAIEDSTLNEAPIAVRRKCVSAAASTGHLDLARAILGSWVSEREDDLMPTFAHDIYLGALLPTTGAASG